MSPSPAGSRRRLSTVVVALSVISSVALAAPPPGSNWNGYEGGAGSTHFSLHRQIDRSTVTSLSPAWRYDLGEMDVSAEPLVLPDRLIVVGKGGAIVAIDPADGHELWRTETGQDLAVVRGFSYWPGDKAHAPRVLFANGTRLRALDPVSGALIADYDVDLRQGLGRDPTKIRRIAPATPGRVFKDLIIVGSLTGEDYRSPPGDVRAYSVITGKLAWTFHTIPHPGELGYETWPADAWKTTGGANDWGGLSVDEARGIAYFVTGAPVYDFYGANRKGANLFADSIVAVDARTGKYLWHFQDVHHDLWDYDLTASPVLLTVRHGGRPTPAVAVAGKTGFLYVFNRVTGKPLWPIEERPVPASDVPGEHAWPTQPFPTAPPPFARQSFTEADVDPGLPAAEREAVIQRLRKARNEGLFTPPALRETVEMPGNHGGANWGQAAGDPVAGFAYILSFDIPSFLQLEEGPNTGALEYIARTRGRGAAVYAANCQLCHGADQAGQPPAIPSLKNITARLAEPKFEAAVREGRGTMPGFAGMSKADMQALSAFLRGEPTLPAVAPTPPPSVAKSDSPEYRSGYGFALSRIGQSVIAPPWQSLTAYDLNTGKLAWRTPVGTAPGRDAPSGLSFSKGGLAVTAGGVVFVSTEADRKLYAYDAKTGRTLWSGSLPSRVRGGLAVYMHHGRQYVVVPVGNAGGISLSEVPDQPGQAGHNAYVAFALPPKP